MRKRMVLAAVVAAFGMVSPPTEAHDRGFGFRHFSGYATPKLHLRHQGFKLHHGGGLVGKLRPFKSRHFGFKFEHAPHFNPRHFGHLRQPGLVLKFSDGDFVLRFGDVPPFKHRHFGHKRHHRTPFFGWTCHGSSGRGPIAALPSRIGTTIEVIAGARRGPKAATGPACTTARRQKPSSKSSSRWAFETC
jgi:hypothetical protein